MTHQRFSTVHSKYYRDSSNRPALRVAHYSQTALLLYELSRQAWLCGDPQTADKIYFLNVAQSSCDIFYEIDLPTRVYCDHPLGSVIGRAQFSADAALSFTTGCTIGNNHGHYPRIVGNLLMLANSAVLGETEIQGTVLLARGASLMDAGVVRDKFVSGSGPTLQIRELDMERASRFSPFAPSA